MQSKAFWIKTFPQHRSIPRLLHAFFLDTLSLLAFHAGRASAQKPVFSGFFYLARAMQKT
jgi:hypothetical protein